MFFLWITLINACFIFVPNLNCLFNYQTFILFYLNINVWVQSIEFLYLFHKYINTFMNGIIIIIKRFRRNIMLIFVF